MLQLLFGNGAPMQQEERMWLEGELRLLRAMVALERGDLTIADEELSRAEAKPGHERLPAMRMQLSRGAKPAPTLEQLYLTTDVKSFPPLLKTDTVAQIALAGGNATDALANDCLPLKRAHPSRVDAMCRMFPEEPATRLALRLKSGLTPYR